MCSLWLCPGQVAFEISLQFIFDKVVDQISPITTIQFSNSTVTNITINDPESVATHHQVSKELDIARWVLLGFIFVEVRHRPASRKRYIIIFFWRVEAQEKVRRSHTLVHLD